MIVVGGSFERGRIVPSLVFGFWWATLVYCPIAYWTWNPDGWLYQLPGLDFAGGGPVHISSGTAALAYALVLGKRKQYGQKHVYKPHNVTIIFLGTVSMLQSSFATDTILILSRSSFGSVGLASMVVPP